MEKIIGTLVPLSAIYSVSDSQHDQGTFKSGMVFLDWLKKTKQNVWQLLPLNTTQLESGSSTKRVPSPYKSYGIGLDIKYLPLADSGIFPTDQEKKDFIADNSDWINDYAFFCALSDYFQTDDWSLWDQGLKNRDKTIIDSWENKLSVEINNHIISQFQLYQSYLRLRSKAKQYNIELVGDLSFYPSLNSPLVWANQDVFQLGSGGKLQLVSGTPDSPKAHFGRQVWGHPLYNWDNQKKVIAFWKMRLRYLSKLFDRIRFDHAKAFFNYGVMDINDQKNDRYQKGPGAKVFKDLIRFARQNNLLIFAEDTGENISEIRKILKSLKCPGIKMLRFAFDEVKNQIIDEYANISSYSELTVAYTSTHDTETLFGYLKILSSKQKQQLAMALKVNYLSDDKQLARKLRDAVIICPAKMVIIPIQDWLLTTDRINIPGTEKATDDPNWHFKLNIPIEDLPTSFY